MKRIIIFILGLVAILVGLMINVQFSNGTGGIATTNSFELQQPSSSPEGIGNDIRFQFNPIKRRKRTIERFEIEKKIQRASSKAKKEKQISEMKKAKENLLSSPCMPNKILPCIRNAMQQIIQQTYIEETPQNLTAGECEPIKNQISNSTVSLLKIAEKNQIGSSSISLAAITEENQINNSTVSLSTENQTAITSSQCLIWIKVDNSLEALREAKQIVEMRIKELKPLTTKDRSIGNSTDTTIETNSIKSPASSLGTEETPGNLLFLIYK